MNLFRSEFTDFYDFFYFGNDKITGESHRAVGSSGIQMEIEIAGCISFRCLNQGNVCMERHLKEIFLAVDCQFLLAVFNFRANTGRCQTAAKTGTAAADTFGPCTLWTEFDIQFACKHLIAGKRIESDMCCYKRFHTFFTDQLAHTLIRHTCGNSNGMDILDTLLKHTVDDLIGGKFTVPVAKHNSLAIMNLAKCFFFAYNFRQQFDNHLS